jgi:hypothetical protein
MNTIYILIPIVVLSLIALMFIRPKLLTINKTQPRYFGKSLKVVRENDAMNDLKVNKIEQHPPILPDMILKKG